MLRKNTSPDSEKGNIGTAEMANVDDVIERALLQFDAETLALLARVTATIPFCFRLNLQRGRDQRFLLLLLNTKKYTFITYIVTFCYLILMVHEFLLPYKCSVTQYELVNVDRNVNMSM